MPSEISPHPLLPSLSQGPEVFKPLKNIALSLQEFCPCRMLGLSHVFPFSVKCPAKCPASCFYLSKCSSLVKAPLKHDLFQEASGICLIRNPSFLPWASTNSCTSTVAQAVPKRWLASIDWCTTHLPCMAGNPSKLGIKSYRKFPAA